MTEVYLYQTIHLFRGRTRLLDEHIAVLDEASRAIFGRPYVPDARQLEARIATLALSERYPSGVSGFVRLELLSDGQERLLPAGASLYEGYALRSLMPDAVSLIWDNPLCDHPTSAREAAASLAHRLAEQTQARVAVRCDSEDVLRSADDAPLFGVRNKRVITAPAPASAERSLGIRAVQAAGLAFDEQPILRDELTTFDELFYVDHRGVTSLAHCDAHALMSLTAERVAAAMEMLFR